jgi:hypothetical protein
MRQRPALAEDHIKTLEVVLRAIGRIGGGHRRAMLPPDYLAPPVQGTSPAASDLNAGA